MSDSKKPILLVRLGDSMLSYAAAPQKEIFPQEEDLRRMQEFLDKKLGDEYHVIVYHYAISMEVVGDRHFDVPTAFIGATEEVKEVLNQN